MAAHQDPKKENAVDLWKRMVLGLVPDDEIRNLMRIGLEKRLKWGYKPTHQQQLAQLLEFAKSLRSMKMATQVETLGAKMYETPSAIRQIMCGSTIKESSGLFKEESTTLDDAITTMMDLYCEEARIEDGQRILDLGCGHGPVVLHMARKYANCHVTGVTNSVSEKDFIVNQCKELELTNVEVILADVTTVDLQDTTYDRVFVIGVIEHMKNIELFLRKISQWMTAEGFLYVEHYCHKTFAYHYEPVDEDDWYTMSMFPPGTMVITSASLLLYFQDDLTVVDHWTLNGEHFARSLEEQLKRMYAKTDEVTKIFETVCGGSKEEALKMFNFWKIFFVTGSEMYGFNNGEEWMISHVLLKKKNV